MLSVVVRRLWWGWLLFALVFTGFKLVDGKSIQTSLFSMFPSQTQTQALDIALKHATGVFEHDLVVMIEGQESQNVLRAANLLIDRLASIDSIHFVDALQRSAFIEQLFKYRQQLMTEDDRDTILRGQSASLTQASLRRLYSPAGVSGQSFLQDPWQTFERYLLTLIGQNDFSYQNGLLVAQQQGMTQALLPLYLNLSAFNSEAIDDIEQLNRLIDDIGATPGVQVNRTGAGFYSASAMALATTEISIIGGGALLMVIGIVIWLFAHPKPLGMTLLSLASGVLCGLAVTLMWFGEVHVLALVMGSSLIGLSFDYSFHYLSYLACAPSQTSHHKLLRQLRPALFLGMLSSVIAYGCLFLAQLPVLNQMALFSVFGLIGALVSVFLIYPSIASFPQSPRTHQVASRLSIVIHRWRRHKGMWLVLSLYGVVVIRALMVGYADDDVRLLQSPDALLIEEEARIKTRLHAHGGSDWVVTLADTPEQVAVQEEMLATKLDKLVTKSELTSYLAATQWIPSQKRQSENWHAYQRLIEQQGDSLVGAVGMSARPASISFDPLLTLDRHGSGDGIPTLTGVLEDGRAFSLLLLNGLVHKFDPNLLSKHQYYLNYVDDIGALLGDYRQRVAKLLIVAIAAVVAVMVVYFGVRRALFLIIPPVLAVIIAAALPAALGMPITLFHVLGLFLIFGIGIDYSVFLMCHGQSSHTMLAVFIAGVSSLLSFGLMSLSSNYAIASFGMTVGIGVLSSWLLAPMVLLGVKSND
ncbi:MMPL family transporter [Vibrio agarivorans]|uniref:MMPL family transporter n=1 Tax=Vibrio agarivorans TaxID=153622 RepID=UPI0022318E94|nr:MMPL family transporter [Vibrio agarivorans]